MSIVRTISVLPLIGALPVSIKIVESEAETRTLTHSARGNWYWRYRRLTYTQEQFDYRMNTKVREVCATWDEGLGDLPLICFCRGGEGKNSGFIGQPSTEFAKEKAKASHRRHRDEHLKQMARYQETKLTKSDE